MPPIEERVEGISVWRDHAPNPRWQFIYAPGAGSNLADPFGAWLAETLPRANVSLVRFQFPYQEAGGKRPDRPAILESTWRAVIESSLDPNKLLVIGGRSMGGRIASIVAAECASIDALCLFAYPLHPPKRPELARTDHLSRISSPTLFLSGTRDVFASPEEIKAATTLVTRGTNHMLEGADHGFSTLKSDNKSRSDIWDEAAQRLLSWLEAL